MGRIKIYPSLLAADFSCLTDEIKRMEQAGADGIHLDVMDGHFVPNITIGPLIVKAIRPLTKLPIEAHLMIEHPWIYMEEFIDAGADIISVHAECYGPLKKECQEFGQYPKEVTSIDAQRVQKDISKIRKKGAKGVVVLNPGTPLCIESLVEDLDGVLVMSVNPGFARQKFMPEALPKIKKLREIYQGDIAIDGGVNKETAPQAVAAGANVLATARYFFGATDPKVTVEYLKSLG